mgnify:FL=1
MVVLLVKYAHFIGFILLGASLVGEHLLIQPRMTKAEVKRVANVDVIFSLGAATLFITGLLLVFKFGKPADYYLSNWVFYFKVSLFISIGIVSLYPMVTFIRLRKGDQQEEVDIPKGLKHVIRFELLVLMLLPLCGVLLANGVVIQW